MPDTFEVKCPDCQNIMVVDKKSGKVLEVRRPLTDDPSDDRFEDARKRVMSQSARAKEAFEQARQREKEKHLRLDALFKEKAEELKDEPIEKPEHPFDRD